jgi:hypothetical protein
MRLVVATRPDLWRPDDKRYVPRDGCASRKTRPTVSSSSWSRGASPKAAAAAARAVAAYFGTAAGEETVDELETFAGAAFPLLEKAGDNAALARIYGGARPGRQRAWALGGLAQAAEQALHRASLASCLVQVGRFDVAWSLAREESQRLLNLNAD